MASNDYEIVNLGLVRLGATRITSLSDGSNNANEANAIYTLIRDEVLRAHPWNFATRKQTLEKRAANVLTITGITKANPGVVSFTGTDPEDGDEYKIESVVGMTEVNDTIFMVEDVVAATSFALHDEDGDEVNTSAYTAYSSGGTATEQIPHTGDWDYVYVKPSDCLRVLSVNDDPDSPYEIDEKGFYHNDDGVEIEYIRQVTAVTVYDATFVDTFAWRIAMELAIKLTGSEKKLKYATEQYIKALDRAKVMDAKEGYADAPEFNKYKNARR